MKGKELRDAIRHSGIPIAELSKKSKIPEPTIYSLYKKDEVEAHYLKKNIIGWIAVEYSRRKK